MKILSGALLGLVIGLLIMAKCNRTQVIGKVDTVTVTKDSLVYVLKDTVITKYVKLKYKTIDTNYVFIVDSIQGKTDTFLKKEPVYTMVVPYQDTVVRISDTITLSGKIESMKRKIDWVRVPFVYRDSTITKTVEVPAKGKDVFSIYGGINSVYNPSVGIQLQNRHNIGVSAGYQFGTKVMEARLYLPLFKIKK